MDDVLKQFMLDLYDIGKEMQKKPPDKKENEDSKVSDRKGSDPISPNHRV